MSSAGSRLHSSGLTKFTIPNGKIVATVSGNALTVELKDSAGNDPSPTNPLYVALPTDQTSGAAFEGRAIVAPLSVTAPNGKTFQTANGVPFRLWLKIYDDGGTPRLGVENCYDGANTYIFPLAEYGLESTTAIATGGGGLAGVSYTTVAVSSKPYRILGFLNWNTGLATAGAWSAGPDEIRMYSGGFRPGQVVQDALQTLQGLSSTLPPAVIPFDATKPQSSEGYQIGSRIITPTSPINLIYNEARIPCSYSIANTLTLALFKYPAADAMAAGWADVRAADVPAVLQVVDCRQAMTVSQLTYLYNVGGSSAGTFYLNGNSAGAIYGNLLALYLRCAEIMV